MPERGSPILRHRRLGRGLRGLREGAGLTGDDVARELSWSAAKVSRIENAKTLPTKRDVEVLLDLYGADRAARQELLELREHAAAKGWWERYRDALHPDLLTLMAMEAEAVEMRNWEPQVVPGLLQTEDYARAFIETIQPILQIPRQWVEARVEARLLRQRTLLHGPDPVCLLAVFAESVLLRQYGSPAVMEAQLRHLIEVSELEHVEVRILEQKVPAPIAAGPFLHLKFLDFPDLLYLEDVFGARFAEDAELVYSYERVFDNLKQYALDEESSRQLIRGTLKHWQQ